MDLDILVQRAKGKDPNAFDTLYKTYYPQMVGICMNIIREDRATANDLVHDAFIMAFVSIESLRDNTKFSEWLTTIVRNVSLKHIEQRNRVRIHSISSIDEEDSVFVDSSSSPDSDLNHKELLELISLLPEGYSKILRLSVIEGFSHKEIAEMLGIEPHSSSSQLTRAKRFLKRMIDGRMAGAIALLLLPFTWYFIFRHVEEQHDEDVIVDAKQVEQTEPDLDNSHLTEQDNSSDESPVMDSSTSTRTETILAEQTGDSILISDTDSDTVIPLQDIDKDVQIAETVEDSLDVKEKDSVMRTVIPPETDYAEEYGKKNCKWEFLATGSLGPTLAQNGDMQIATNPAPPPGIGSSAPEPDGPTYVVPEHVNTWEDYSQYLRFISSPDAPADTLALIEITDNNTGKIEQREHHDKPITFGLSLTRSLGGKWSLGTGLQYSILNSQFSLGENGYSVVDKQKAHYLGIPLQVSYNWTSYKRLSAYSSVGVTLHIPVYGKVKSDWLVNWQSVYSENRYYTPSLQWQTGISFGLQYKFAPHTSIFAEPTFNWFIPSGSETHTIWTEHPIMFTCPFGIRITW